MECDPTASEGVVKVATAPADNVPAPREVAPSKKLTVPMGLGVLLVVPATVALKVNDWPVMEGFNEEVSVVVVGTFAGALTTSLNADDVEFA